MSTKTNAPTDVRPLARAIAALLPGFAFVEYRSDYATDRATRCYLRHPDGREMFLLLGVNRYDRAPQGMVQVSGRYGEDNGKPVYPQDFFYDKGTEPTINVSASKTPEQIAKDIERRFMPAYNDLWARCQEWVRKNEAYRFDVANVTKLIAAYLGAAPDRIRFDSDGNEARVTRMVCGRVAEFRTRPDYVSIDATVSPELAAKIAALMAEEANKASE